MTGGTRRDRDHSRMTNRTNRTDRTTTARGEEPR